LGFCIEHLSWEEALVTLPLALINEAFAAMFQPQVFLLRHGVLALDAISL
jgi:hypothetical protein